MVFNRTEIVQRARASKSNPPRGCQLWTREIIGVNSVGDWDGDGDADAVDGWKSEPEKYKHPGDRHPLLGSPVAWSGGSKGYGHRAIYIGSGQIASSDAGGLGVPAVVRLEWVEDHWGLHYLGWSKTMSGVLIPDAPVLSGKPEHSEEVMTRVERFLKGGPQWDVKLLDNAVKNDRHGVVMDVRNAIDKQVKRLPHDANNTRVRQFAEYYRKDRVLHMGLLTQAVKHGRTGTVKSVRDEIRRQINTLPSR